MMNFFGLLATVLVATTHASTTQTVTFSIGTDDVITGCLIGIEGEDLVVTSVLSNFECTATQNGCSVEVPLNSNSMTVSEYAWTNGCTGLVLGEPLVLSLPESWDVLRLSNAVVDESRSELVERQLEGEDASAEEIGLLVLLIAGLFAGVTGLSIIGGLC